MMNDDISPRRRIRRAHSKSRTGCVRCKLARRKCDEVKPSCTRCRRRGIECQYLGGSPETQEPDVWKDLENLTSTFGWEDLSGATPDSRQSGSDADYFPVSPDLDFSLDSDGSLSQQESELFNHYLAHAARSFSYDADDLYALQIGIPNLAFQSKLLMKSILALALISKCHDLVALSGKGSALVTQELRHHMTRADHYHTEAICQTQTDIGSPGQSECVLANAPLMVLYGLASQSLRIKLATQVHSPIILSPDLAPAPSQWLSIIRTAHGAYTGLNQAFHTTTIDMESPSVYLPSPFGPGSPNPQMIGYNDSGTSQTKQLILPVISATIGPALAKLRSKAEGLELLTSLKPAPPRRDTSRSEQQQIQISLEALTIVEEIASMVCSQTHGYSISMHDFSLDTPVSTTTTLSSSWLQSYLGRVTSATPSAAPHRTIMSFVHRAPSAYLFTIQDVLEKLPADSSESQRSPFPKMSNAEKLALEVFAHWLVLVMLTDDVWWIGDIGAWELKRMTALFKSGKNTKDADRSWWPGSMERIRDEMTRCTS